MQMNKIKGYLIIILYSLPFSDILISFFSLMMINIAKAHATAMARIVGIVTVLTNTTLG